MSTSEFKVFYCQGTSKSDGPLGFGKGKRLIGYETPAGAAVALMDDIDEVASVIADTISIFGAKRVRFINSPGVLISAYWDINPHPLDFQVASGLEESIRRESTGGEVEYIGVVSLSLNS